VLQRLPGRPVELLTDDFPRWCVFDLVELQADAGIEPGVRDMAAYKAFVVFIIGVVDWDEIGLNSRAADLTSILFDRHALALHGTPGLTPRGGAVLRDRIVAIAGEDGLRCTIGYAALARLGITCRRRQPQTLAVWLRATEAILAELES
jgi:hypothetical protein